MDEIKEQKLAAARKKLRKFQKKKGEERAKLGVSREITPDYDVVSACDASSNASIMDSNDAFSYGAKTSVLEQSDNSTGMEINVRSVDPESENHFTDTIYYQTPDYSDSPISDDNVKEFSPVPFNYPNMNEQNYALLESDTKLDFQDQEGSVSSETNISLSTVINVKENETKLLEAQFSDHMSKSTTESLRQLSLQMSGLVNDIDKTDPSGLERTIMELEERNNELASLLSAEKQKAFQHAQLLEELRARLSTQDAQIQTFQNMALTGNNSTEIMGLREQLQVHIQTIGILVAEKSDLQSALANARHTCEQKTGEVTDFQGRLDASRQRIRDLESTIQKLELETSTLNNYKENSSQQLSNLKADHTKLSKLCEELRASVAELTERLAVKSEENKKHSGELSELRNQYDLAEIHIQQLKDSSQDDLRLQLEQLQMAYRESQSEIMNFKAAIEEARREKSQLEEEYKAYASQLAAEVEILKEKLNCEEEKGRNYEKKMLDLEESLDVEKAKNSQSCLPDFEEEKSILLDKISRLHEDRSQLEERCSSLVSDNGQLSHLLSEQTARLESMEAMVDRNTTNHVDTSQLLQSMQSDKIAAARALTQNKQLKEQLEELQNGFIMMSNKKLELTEKLERELHIKKSLHQEISKLEEEIASQKEAILAQRRETESLRSQFIADDLVEKVYSNNQNGESPLKTSHKCTKFAADTNRSPDIHKACMQKTSNVESHFSQNGLEIGVEATQDGELQEPVVEEKDHQSNEVSYDRELDGINCQSVAFKDAHEALEKRFLQCMRDLASVSDEKQNLEHLVQKLQLETDTVGDYITIYQFQRGVMKQQMQELRVELDLLRTEKEEMFSKFNQLQKLFTALTNDAVSQEQLFGGINSILINNSSLKDANEVYATSTEAPIMQDVANSIENNSNTTAAGNLKNLRTGTVKQIIDLLNEMETSSQLDTIALHKFHPCPHCSGKLLTV